MGPWRVYVKDQCLENRAPIVAVDVCDRVHPRGSFVCVSLEDAKKFVHLFELDQARSMLVIVTSDIDLLNMIDYLEGPGNV